MRNRASQIITEIRGIIHYPLHAGRFGAVFCQQQLNMLDPGLLYFV